MLLAIVSALAALAAGVTGAVGVGLAVLSAMAAPVWLYFLLLAVQGCATSIHAPAEAGKTT